MDNFGFLLKVMAISTGLAIAIKLGTAFPPPSPNLLLVLTLVLSPTLVMFGVLLWRMNLLKSDSENY